MEAPPRVRARPTRPNSRSGNPCRRATTLAEYRADLARFPDGTFTALAHARLSGATPPGEVSTKTESVELAFWDSIKGSDSKAMSEAYLQKYQDGEFRALAEIRIAELARTGTN